MKKALSIITICSLALSACIGSKQTPATETYSFEPTLMPSTVSLSKTNPVLRITPANIAPQFSNYSFIYRSSETQYLIDPYRQFLTAPNIEITTYLTNTLAPMLKSNLIFNDNLASANFVLQENVPEFYADYRHKSAPEAVLTIEFILYHCDGDKKSLVGTTTLTARSSISPNNPSSLIDGYQKI